MKPRRKAVVVGFEYYGRFLARLLNEHSQRWHLEYFPGRRLAMIRAMVAMLSADALVTFGGPAPNVALLELARRRKIPVIVIWAGTDVLVAKDDPHMLELIKNYKLTNVSDGPWLVDELRALGIESTYVPVTAVTPPAQPAPLPSTFRVLACLPEPRRPFYGERAVYDIARAFPDVPFTVIGAGKPNPIAPANVEFTGFVDDVAARIDESTVVLRMPQHDGKSMLVLEALARGRHVLWNYDFPGVVHTERTLDAIAALRGLREMHDAGTLDVNRAGFDYVSKTFAREVLAAGFVQQLEEAKPVETNEGASLRVAVSGLTLFAAQIVKIMHAYPMRWRPEILRVSARLEVLTSILNIVNADVWYSIGAPIGDRWLHLAARLMRKPRVIHWVGTDITTLYRHPSLIRLCQRPGIENLAEVDWTIEALRKLGISATLAPLPPGVVTTAPPPLPEKFTVLLYLPRTRGEFYGRAEYERLMRAFARDDVRFIVVGGGEFYAPPEADVQRLGWVSSLADVYAHTSALVRFTRSDGLSIMVLEALTHARHVLWSQDFPYTTLVSSYADVEIEIRRLYDLHRSGDLAPQLEAAAYIAETYDTRRCLERIATAWDRAYQSSQRNGAVALEVR
jgi:hypothetical protein